MPEPTLRYFACGDTRFPLSRVFRGGPPGPRVFPSAVFLYTHPDGARVLFDTGYPPTLRGTGAVGALYRRILPARVSGEQTIDRQLAALGITTDAIAYVVLSHLHPDHIGGVRYFPSATFVVSAGLQRRTIHHRVTDGVLPALLPDWFEGASKRVIEDGPTVQVAGVQGLDLFDDGRLVVTPLPGHADGHLGVLVEGTHLLAGDAAWGREYLEWSDRIRWLPRLISHDLCAHHSTSVHLLQLEHSGITLCFSHDRYPSAVVID